MWIYFLTVSVHRGPEWTNPGPLLKSPIATIHVSLCCSFWAWGCLARSCSCWQKSVPFSLPSFCYCWLPAEGHSQSLEATYIALHCGILSQHGTSLLQAHQENFSLLSLRQRHIPCNTVKVITLPCPMWPGVVLLDGNVSSLIPGQCTYLSCRFDL